MAIQFKYMGQLGSCSTGYRGFAFTSTVIRNAQGQLTKIPCLAIFSDFDLKDKTKEFCKKRGGTWAPAPQKFWYVPVKSSKISLDCVTEAVAIAQQYCAEIREYQMFASGFEGTAASQLQEVCEGQQQPKPTDVVLGTNKGKGPAPKKEERKPATSVAGDYEALRHVIKKQFPDLNKEKLTALFSFLEAHAFNDPVDFEFDLKRSFAPETREKIRVLQMKYDAIREQEIEQECKRKNQIAEHLRSQMWWLQEENIEPPEAYLEISADWVRVEGSRNDGHFGLGDRLPKGHGRKHRGDKSWQFELSALPLLKQLGFPEVHHPNT